MAARQQDEPLIVPLDDPGASLETVGGKAESLARLARAGFPVPHGFCLTTAAYRLFVRANALDLAAADLRQRFESAPLPQAIATALDAAYAPLHEQPVAVRSSATAEDLPDLSFAGQHETFLNVRGRAQLELAVRRCWASLWSERAVAYRQHAGVAEDVALAVVVQSLVAADVAGVAFSVDPVTGQRERVVVDGAWGLGESIVGGLVTPDAFVVDRASGEIVEQRIADKTEMTVASASGTVQQPVPEALRRAASLTSTQAQEIASTALRIEAVYGHPVDVEWAIADGRLFVLQARPITALAGADRDPWNDSRLGDFLWTSGNLGEAVPDVMTPVTWSLMQRLTRDALADISIPGGPMVGNIGGRCYMNLSLLFTLAASFGATARAAAANEEVFGRLPPGLEIPRAPISRWTLLRAVAPSAARILTRTRRYQSRIAGFAAGNPAHCEAVRSRIATMTTPRALASLWHGEVEPLFREGCFMLQAAGRQGNSALVMTRAHLRDQVGEEDADALFSGLHSEDHQLASLGLLEGLQQVAAGRIDAEEFARRYGHRGPHEFEVAQPRPGEDPRWLEQQLSHLRSGELERLFEHRQVTRAQAWQRFEQQQPAETVKRVRRDVAEWGRIARDREATRSELVRVFWVMRDFLLRAGQVTATGDDFFYLPIDDVLSVLDGSRPMPDVSPSRSAFQRYSALPAYPRLIRGRFDPYAWAADPKRRSDLFVAGVQSVPSSDAIVGFPGAAGVVEAIARVLDTPEQGDQLQAGEVLVTRVTNVGWTPLFLRAAAVVTDVGAPLSHAAIVARELGIPAVVGCGNATMRLRSGDHVRVDGSRGTVEVL